MLVHEVLPDRCLCYHKKIPVLRELKVVIDRSRNINGVIIEYDAVQCLDAVQFCN